MFFPRLVSASPTIQEGPQTYKNTNMIRRLILSLKIVAAVILSFCSAKAIKRALSTTPKSFTVFGFEISAAFHVHVVGHGERVGERALYVKSIYLATRISLRGGALDFVTFLISRGGDDTNVVFQPCKIMFIPTPGNKS